MNIYLILQMASDAMGDRIAIKSGKTQMSYAQIAEATRYFASKIKPKHRRLGYFHETSHITPITLFTAALKGIPFVPLNYRLSEKNVSALLKRIRPAQLVTNKEIKEEEIDLIQLEHSITKDEFFEEDAPDVEGSIAVELFTSGTTGEPKSAILRHDNLMSYILSTVEFMSASEDEASLMSVPPYHIAGISAILSSTYAGRRIVLLENFTPENWIKLADEESITHSFVVPTMLQRIIDYAEQNGGLSLPNMRAIAYGGGKMPKSVITAAMKALPHVDFTNAYGLTETSSTISLLTPDDHRIAYESNEPHIQKRLFSVGKVLPSLELVIYDETKKVCPPGVTGFVHVRGEQVSGEYNGKGSRLDENGWFSTQDLGYVDEEGYLFLDGRADDVIVRGGENISPGEIEDLLIQHPEIKDVAIVAIADTEWGEAIGAVIVVNNIDSPPLVEDIKSYVKTHLRSSYVPSKIIFASELPYNETGKLLRRVLRDEFVNGI